MQVKGKSQTASRFVVEFAAKENTWSNQRRKRREEKRRSSDPPAVVDQPSAEEPEPKKAKLDIETVDVPNENNNFFLKGLVIVEKTPEDDNAITSYIQWLEGGSGRESINQILQYLKNNLFSK